jgi:hypothetical protein
MASKIPGVAQAELPRVQQKFGSARLGDLAEHAGRLVGVVWAVQAGARERSGYFLVCEVRVLLKKEPPPVRNVGRVNDRLQGGPVEGTEGGSRLRVRPCERLLGEANAERLRELPGDRSDN